MLTPRDIHEMEFKRVLRGYSPDEVDAFLGRVVSEYEALYRENEKLREQIEELKARLEEYARAETQIDETLELAKMTAADVKSAAQRESAALLQEAEMRARSLLAEAKSAAEEERRRLEEYRRHIRLLRADVKSIVRDFERRLDELDPSEELRAGFAEVAADDDQEPEGAGRL